MALPIEDYGIIGDLHTVALVGRDILKFRDVWDVWFLQSRLDATVDRAVVQKKFVDYGISNIAAKAEKRPGDLARKGPQTPS